MRRRIVFQNFDFKNRCKTKIKDNNEKYVDESATI